MLQTRTAKLKVRHPNLSEELKAGGRNDRWVGSSCCTRLGSQALIFFIFKI